MGPIIWGLLSDGRTKKNACTKGTARLKEGEVGEEEADVGKKQQRATRKAEVVDDDEPV